MHQGYVVGRHNLQFPATMTQISPRKSDPDSQLGLGCVLQKRKLIWTRQDW